MVLHARANARASITGAALLGLVLGAFAVFLWWRGAFIGVHDVDASVTFVGAGGSEMQSLRLFAGGDKAFWPAVAAGETARTRLFTGGLDTALTMQLVLQGQQINWDGPMFPAGTGYRIKIHVDANGQVSEQHCVLPCSIWW